MTNPTIQDMNDEQLLRVILTELDGIRDSEPERYHNNVHKLISAFFKNRS